MPAIQVTVPVQILLRLSVATQLSENVTLPSIGNSSLVTADNRTTESRALPPGYVAFPEYGLAYKYFANSVSYNEAISLCSNENGQLAVIDSSEKVQKILDNFSFLELPWVGLLVPHGTEGWTTTDGKPRNYLPWASGEPNGNGKCAFLQKNYNGLRNGVCSSRGPYLCEIALAKN